MRLPMTIRPPQFNFGQTAISQAANKVSKVLEERRTASEQEDHLNKHQKLLQEQVVMMA